jgi:hypothetical protein
MHAECRMSPSWYPSRTDSTADMINMQGKFAVSDARHRNRNDAMLDCAHSDYTLEKIKKHNIYSKSYTS